MAVNFHNAMMAAKPALARNGLLTLYYSGAHLLAPASMRGIGTIFMLHRVREPDATAFQPNRILEITPDYLEAVLHRIHETGMVCVSLDEAARRIETGDTSERFCVFTLDDGYKDNLDVAAPIFARYRVPFTVYLATDLPDGTAELWWVALERVIAAASDLRVQFPDGEVVFASSTVAEKYAAWHAVYWRLRGLGEQALRAEVRRLGAEHGIDMAALTRELAMSWSDVRKLSNQCYASIEAHTASHVALSQMTLDDARADIVRGIARHEDELGRRPVHFSYPYGDPTSAGERDFELVKDFGFRSATTTRKGFIRASHAQAMTCLPRLSLNGDYQDLRIFDVLMSGLPFALAKSIRPSGFD